MNRPIITFTTDFGTRDAYVAAMKGVILSVCPNATLVDVSHEIERHNIAEAAYTLASASMYFPDYSIHVAVVDPGVGSSRRPVALQTPRGVYVCPDNGALTHVLNESGARIPEAETRKASAMVQIPDDCRAYELDKPEFWLPNITRTFHGRDVFAPVAANIANGVPISKLGSRVETLARLPIASHSYSDGGAATGSVIHIDTYGNLVTNIPASAVPEDSEVRVAGRSIAGLSESYSESVGELLAIIGSRSTLEIAFGEGDARRVLEASVGDQVVVQRRAISPTSCPD